MRENKRRNGKFNHAFYKLRADRDWSQEEMANHLGCTRQYIAQVESGTCYGKIDFWEDVQDFFHIPDSKMWTLINGKLRSVGSPPIHFLCDGKQCKNCKPDICAYTTELLHAKNFEYDGYIGFWENKN